VTPTKSLEPVNEPHPLPITPGQIIGERYRVGPMLGSGGMGVVCEATHLGLDVPVAIKFIRTDLKHDPELVQRFMNEARRAAALQNEHVARVHDVGQLASGDLYLVMERLEGVGLDAHLRDQGPLPQADAVNLVRQACEGLSEAHAAGIVHRDIKPENLFLARRSDGKRIVKILDFGISKQTTGDAPTSLTNSERSLGSPWYMSPEQMIDTSSVDHRADIWSLGVVLFELLTATRPFEGTSIPEVCAGVLTVATPALRERRPDIDPTLAAIVERCLAKNPDERPASVLELSRNLEPFTASPEAAVVAVDTGTEDAFFNGEGDFDQPAPISFVPLSRKSLRRMTLARWLGVLGILLTLVLAIAAFSGAWRESRALPSDPAVAPPPPAVPVARVTTPPPPSAEPVTVVPVPLTEEKPSEPRVPTAGNNAKGDAPSAASATAQPTPARRPASDRGVGRQPPAAETPVLTPEEIRRRKERYERWLREQGLQRVDEVVVPRDSETPGN
jgi:eukaryotic-like serine/threonine-protein kinase